jgi:hypothetical protein
VSKYYYQPCLAAFDVYTCPSIIAITGRFVHAFGSWRLPDRSDLMWLHDILPMDYLEAQILTWGYHSGLKDAAAGTSIADISRNVLQDINIARYRGVITPNYTLNVFPFF